MSLIDIKINKSLEKIIKTNLQQGIDISASEVLEELATLLEEVSTTDKNFDLENAIVKERSESSSSAYNTTIDQIHMDLEDAYDSILMIAETRAGNFERWKLKLIDLSRKTQQLKASLNSLLLLKKDTAGYFDMLEDHLDDANALDIVNSSVEINLDNHTVVLPVDPISKQIVNLNSLFAEDVVFNPITRENLLSYNVMPGSSVLNAFKDASNVWQHRVFMGTYDRHVDVELKVKISDEPISINRIEFISHSSDTSSTIDIKAQYSLDDYNWFDIDAINNPQSVISTGFFDFQSVDIKYVKFIMTKNGHDYEDGTSYVYEFGAKNISFFSRSYSAMSGELVTEELSVYDTDVSPQVKKNFNIISCEVCEILPEGTEIEYLVSSDGMQTWSGISPLNQISSPYPKILKLGGSSDVGSGTDVNLDLSTQYTYKNNNDRLLDYTINVSVQESPYEYIKIWRDVGQNNDSILTRGVVSGWQFDETFYTTYLNVDNEAGIYIELGDTVAELDAQRVTGTVFISGGAHKFKTHKSNWKILPSAFDPETEEDFTQVDTLYPYNHKLIIESFDYAGATSYSGTEVYSGVDLYASYIMKYSTLFDFNYNILNDDYTRYSIINDSNILKFFVKYDNNVSDFQDESFYITSRTISSSVDSIRLKVILKTENQDISPIFTGYRIKVGN